MTTMALFYIDDSLLIGLGEVFHETENNVFVLWNTLISARLIDVDWIENIVVWWISEQ
jgi:hypothetical protein